MCGWQRMRTAWYYWSSNGFPEISCSLSSKSHLPQISCANKSALSWRLPIPVSSKLNNELAQHQKSVAKYAYTYNSTSPFPTDRRAPLMTCSNVTSLEIHQVYDMKSVESVSGIIWKCKHLTDLSLGFNRDKMYSYLELLGAGSAARFSFWSHLQTRATTKPAEGEKLVLSLNSLKLSRMSVEKLEDLVDLGALKSLSLDDCPSTELLLALWNTSDRERNLKCLHVKPVAGEGQGVESQLIIFLTKFSSLGEFAFMHPTDVFYQYDTKSLLDWHWGSLRAVVLDDSPTTGDRATLHELYNKCPRLLGIGVQVSFNNLEVFTPFPSPFYL